MTTTTSPNLREAYQRKLLKALSQLEYSYRKVLQLTNGPRAMDEEVLETWESFTVRFSRVVDLFLTKYLKARVLAEDPGFEGTLRDFADFAEKLRIIDSSDDWMDFRGFRNLLSHEYEEEELGQNLADMRRLTPTVLALKERL